MTHSTTLYDTIRHYTQLHYTASLYNTLQCAATHCTTNPTDVLSFSLSLSLSLTLSFSLSLSHTPTSGSIADLGLTSTDYVEVCPQSGITSSLSNLELNAMREAYAGMLITNIILTTLDTSKCLPVSTLCLFSILSIYCRLVSMPSSFFSFLFSSILFTTFYFMTFSHFYFLFLNFSIFFL